MDNMADEKTAAAMTAAMSADMPPLKPEKVSDKSPSQKPAISIKDLTKVFVIGKEKVRALAGVSLDIYPNEIVCLLGTSGSGKSTLLNMMAGLEKPTKGSITIFGERVDKMSERKLAMFRQKNMGFVFQSYNLLPNLTAIDNVAMPMMFSGIKRRVRDKQAKQMLKMCGLGKRMRHKPTQMSGGQQQRVGIARAFVAKPKIVFADEPTGNLDTRTTIEIMEMMVSMARENHQTLVIVTHDVEIAAYADKIYHIIDGIISSVEDNRHNQISVGSQEAADIIAAAESV
jgi:putative ABC transport system ATP-binding protein